MFTFFIPRSGYGLIKRGNYVNCHHNQFNRIMKPGAFTQICYNAVTPKVFMRGF